MQNKKMCERDILAAMFTVTYIAAYLFYVLTHGFQGRETAHNPIMDRSLNLNQLQTFRQENCRESSMLPKNVWEYKGSLLLLLECCAAQV